MKQFGLQFIYSFLVLCARHYIKRTEIKVIGITGSVGKTSCRMLVSQVLQQIPSSYKFYTSPKNYNSELGLVFSVFRIEEYSPSIKNLLGVSLKILTIAFFEAKKYDILVAEYGIDSPNDMEQLLKIAVPDIAILTKLDSVHSANYPGGIEQYWEEKWLLLLSAKNKIFVNLQDEYSQDKVHLLEEYSELFGNIDELNLKLQKLSESEIVRSFTYRDKNFSINLIGEENVHYTKLAIDIAEFLGIYLDRNQYNFNFKLQEGRFTIFNKGQNVFIDSTYNAAPESTKLAIENTQVLRDELYENHKIIFVLGDMRELGTVSESAHKSLAKKILSASAIFTVGPQMYEYLKPELEIQKYQGYLKSGLSSRETGKNVKKYLKDNHETQYIILFKGSQNTIFTEEALGCLLTQAEQKRLPRQSESWKSKKDKFFMSV
ncbi:hypothetical protein GW846_00385 [Candidatus Gracilibacteria bacterium]|nr:hypothetical protein [Candidatus Gracilibacteria bacterium]